MVCWVGYVCCVGKDGVCVEYGEWVGVYCFCFCGVSRVVGGILVLCLYEWVGVCSCVVCVCSLCVCGVCMCDFCCFWF